MSDQVSTGKRPGNCTGKHFAKSAGNDSDKLFDKHSVITLVNVQV